MIEAEIKVKIENPDDIRKKILALGAKLISKETEIDVYYDLDKDLIKKDQIRRLRKKGNKSTLTYKSPRKIEGGLQKRDEIEIYVEDFEKMRGILKNWGHSETNISEKVRETYKLDSVEILLDKLPFLGWYLEIEDLKESGNNTILNIANKLGIDLKNSENRHYGEIFWEYCKKNMCPYITEMTFENEKKWES